MRRDQDRRQGLRWNRAEGLEIGAKLQDRPQVADQDLHGFLWNRGSQDPDRTCSEDSLKADLWFTTTLSMSQYYIRVLFYVEQS